MKLSIVNRSKLNSESRFDAEFYGVENLASEDRVRNRPHVVLSKLCKLVAGPFGSTVTTDNYVPNSGFRYIRGKDMHGLFIDNSDPVFIGKEQFEELAQFHIGPRDLLVTVVGMNFGEVGVIFPEDCPAIFSCKSSLLRDCEIRPTYLAAYLSSKYGYALIRRGRRGAAQPGINLFDLRQIPVPVVDDLLEKKIESIVLESRSHLVRSESLFRDATRLLLTNLGLQNWRPIHDLTFVRKFSDSVAFSRADAEYFQPKYEAMFTRLARGVRVDRLGSLTTLKKGIEVGSAAYSDVGVPFWRVSDLTKYGLEDATPVRIEDDLYQRLRRSCEPQRGELVLSKDATPGVAFYLNEAIEGIVSGGIVRLLFTDPISPHYLEIVLNSPFVQMQIQRQAGGSVIRHWKPSDIRNTVIPRLDGALEEEIAGLVLESHGSRQASRMLLGKARRAIEMAIEQNQEQAIGFLTEAAVA